MGFGPITQSKLTLLITQQANKFRQGVEKKKGVLFESQLTKEDGKLAPSK